MHGNRREITAKIDEKKERVGGLQKKPKNITEDKFESAPNISWVASSQKWSLIQSP